MAPVCGLEFSRKLMPMRGFNSTSRFNPSSNQWSPLVSTYAESGSDTSIHSVLNGTSNSSQAPAHSRECNRLRETFTRSTPDAQGITRRVEVELKHGGFPDSQVLSLATHRADLTEPGTTSSPATRVSLALSFLKADSRTPQITVVERTQKFNGTVACDGAFPVSWSWVAASTEESHQNCRTRSGELVCLSFAVRSVTNECRVKFQNVVIEETDGTSMTVTLEGLLSINMENRTEPVAELKIQKVTF